MKALQIWEYPSAQPTLRETIDYAKAKGFDTILAKGGDGVYFHASYTEGSDYIGNARDCARYTDICHEAGLQFHTWHVPRPNVDMNVQASLMSDLAHNSDALWIDAEPYPAFWGIQSEAKVRALMGALRELAPDRILVLQPDPRPARFAELRGEVWMEYCDAMAGQHYWSDFWPPSDPSDALKELRQAEEYSTYFGKPVYPTCPSNCSPNNLTPEVLDAIAKFSGFAVFRMGSGPDINFTTFGGIKLEEGTPQVSETDQLRQDNAYYKMVLGTLKAQIVPGLRGEATRKSGVRRTQITAIANLLENTIDGALG